MDKPWTNQLYFDVFDSNKVARKYMNLMDKFIYNNNVIYVHSMQREKSLVHIDEALV